MTPRRRTAATSLSTLRAKPRSWRSPQYVCWGHHRRGGLAGQGGYRDAVRALLPEQRLDPFFQLLERHRALQPHTVEKESRRRRDLDFPMRVLLIGVQLVELRLVFLAGLDVLLAHAVLPPDIDQRILGLRHQAVLQLE